MSSIVVGIYYHPEGYPPTLNAVQELSKCFSKVAIVHRPNLKGSWQYPANVQAIASGSYMSSRDQERSPVLKKIKFFIQFAFDLLGAIRKSKAAVVLLYDVHALFAYNLVRKFISHKHVAWYHNHDVFELSGQRKHSIGWYACKAERKMFNKLGIFTLPTADRLPYFSMDELKGKCFVVPNYPSREFYGKFYKPKKLNGQVKLVFQGRIADGLGLEQVIPLLAEDIAGNQLELVLIGSCDESYKQSLQELAASYNVSAKLSFTGFVAYKELPVLSSACHIGLGIYCKKDVMQMTIGSASNKFYEYAALGLPVLYLNEERFTRYLEQYEWAFAVSESTESIKLAIKAIIENYERCSASANQSFLQLLNFEKSFSPVMEYLKQLGYCKNQS